MDRVTAYSDVKTVHHPISREKVVHGLTIINQNDHTMDPLRLYQTA